MKGFIIANTPEELEQLKIDLEIQFSDKIYLYSNLNEKEFIFPVQEGFEVIRFRELIFCESFNSFTIFHLNNNSGKKKIISKGIGSIEKKLPEYLFFRIHNQFLVNRNYISKYIKSDKELYLNTNEKKLPVAKRREKNYLKWWGV